MYSASWFQGAQQAGGESQQMAVGLLEGCVRGLVREGYLVEG